MITYRQSEQCTDTDKQIRRQIIMGQLNAFAHLFDIEICDFKWLNRIGCMRENANIEKSTCFQCKQMPYRTRLVFLYFTYFLYSFMFILNIKEASINKNIYAIIYYVYLYIWQCVYNISQQSTLKKLRQ